MILINFLMLNNKRSTQISKKTLTTRKKKTTEESEQEAEVVTDTKENLNLISESNEESEIKICRFWRVVKNRVSWAPLSHW